MEALKQSVNNCLLPVKPLMHSALQSNILRYCEFLFSTFCSVPFDGEYGFEMSVLMQSKETKAVDWTVSYIPQIRNIQQLY
jgi:hypothetical protein